MADAATTTVHLVRHAAHDRVHDTLVGRMPGVRLGILGRAQAARLAAFFGRTRLSAVLSSPQERALKTAAPIAEAQGLEPEPRASLDEIDFAEWTGRTFAELDADPRWRSWNAARADGCPPGGEPMRAVEARAGREVASWQAAWPGGTVVGVGHADVLKAVICGLLGLSTDRLHAFDLAPASVSTLALWPGGGKLLALNAQPTAEAAA